MIEQNRNIIPATGSDLSRTLRIERSVFGPDRVFLGVRDDLEGRQIGAHLIGSEVHELIEALKPYDPATAPATVKDLDGDFWVEVEPEIFEIVDGTNRKTLDEIAAFYGLDDGEPEPRFGLGDRVRLVSSPYGGASRQAGAVGTVQQGKTGGWDYRLTIDGDTVGGLWGFTESDLEAYEEPKPDPIGSQVYVTGDGEEWGHTFPIGTLVEIRDDDYLFDGSYFVRAVEGEHADYVGGTDLSLEAPRLPLFEVGDRVASRSFSRSTTGEGEIVHVVQDSQGFSGFYEVQVDGGDYGRGCATHNPGAGTFPESSLTKVEEPEPEVLKADDVVRVREHYKHFLTDGSLAEIVEGGPDTFTVRALEPLKDGRPAGTTQYVNADVLTKTEPLAEWERELLGMAESLAEVTDVPRERFYSPPVLPAFPKVVLGMDPSVKDWSGIMKDSIMTIPEPVEIGVLEPEYVVPDLEVGDRVQVIDANGCESARLSDEGTVTRVAGVGFSARGPIVEIETDDGRRYGMFASRFEKVIREVWEPQVGDRVVLVEEKGDGSSAAKAGDLGVIESIQEDADPLDGALLFVKMDDGHTTTRFASRWDKSEDVYCRLCGGKCAVNDPVR